MKSDLTGKRKNGPGKPFEKGNPGNPYGRNGKLPKMTMQRAECKERLMDAMHKVMAMPVEEVNALAEAQSVRSADALMAAVMVRGIKSGNPMHAQFFMTYTFGKPFEYDPTKDTEMQGTAAEVDEIPRDVLVGIVRMLNEQRRASVPAGS